MKEFSKNMTSYFGVVQGWLSPSDQTEAKSKSITIFTYFQNVQEGSFILRDVTKGEKPFYQFAWSKNGYSVQCPMEEKIVKIYNMKLSVNGQPAIKIEKFRSMLLPESIAVCDECQFKINCSDQGGR